MSTTHTPGPWVWYDEYSLRPAKPEPYKQHVHTILDLESTGCGYWVADNADVLAELDADRRLIAAAPDLLTSLKRLLLSADAVGELLNSCEYRPDRAAEVSALREVMDEAANAIAKAEGRTL